jgi:hypothetical protein
MCKPLIMETTPYRDAQAWTWQSGENFDCLGAAKHSLKEGSCWPHLHLPLDIIWNEGALACQVMLATHIQSDAFSVILSSLFFYMVLTWPNFGAHAIHFQRTPYIYLVANWMLHENVDRVSHVFNMFVFTLLACCTALHSLATETYVFQQRSNDAINDRQWTIPITYCNKPYS